MSNCKCDNWRGGCTCEKEQTVEQYNQFLISEIERLQEENANLRIELTNKYVEDTKTEGS